jgi:aerobic-type carbon monoxide dehydrogenase small subunit (CoxS/CutS family)
MGTVSELRVNGSKSKVQVEDERNLLSVLRDDLDLTGSKYGCGEGRCGACTVLIDGKATRSCVTAVGVCQDKEITTIEHLEKDGKLHPLQEAFIAHDALQCGYCTAGMIMSAAGFLGNNADPSPSDIVQAMEGNMCRCGTYPRIVTAIRQAAAALKGATP